MTESNTKTNIMTSSLKKRIKDNLNLRFLGVKRIYWSKIKEGGNEVNGAKVLIVPVRLRAGYIYNATFTWTKNWFNDIQKESRDIAEEYFTAKAAQS